MKLRTPFLLIAAAVVLAAMGKKLGDLLAAGMRIRVDPSGDGHYGTGRTGHIHQGIDLEVVEGEPVYSPVTGFVVRLTRPYANDPKYGGIVLLGGGYEVKVFYLVPEVAAGEHVTRGQRIGTAQAISEKYGPPMKDHLHVELRTSPDRVLVDPAPLFNLA